MAEKLKTLADQLGPEHDPAGAAAEAEAARLEAEALALCTTGKDFAEHLLQSKQYRESVMRRIVVDALPSAVEVMLFHYAYGKPVERVEVRDTNNSLENLTAEELEARALFLADLARRMREDDSVPEQVH